MVEIDVILIGGSCNTVRFVRVLGLGQSEPYTMAGLRGEPSTWKLQQLPVFLAKYVTNFLFGGGQLDLISQGDYVVRKQRVAAIKRFGCISVKKRKHGAT